MSKPLPPEHVRQVKTALRSADLLARESRIAWTDMRDMHHAGVEPMGVAEATINMWDAEAALNAAAIEWRRVLYERDTIPVADRWDLAALERWSAAQDKAGAP